MGRRNKLITAREPNGRIQRSPTVAPSEAKRIRDEAVRKSRQSEYGSELGRLWLDDKITAPMYEAGKKWVIVAVAYSMALLSPSANPRSLNVGSGGESHPVDPDSPQGEREAKFHRKAISTYLDAVDSMSRANWAAVETVCDKNLALAGYQQLLDLRHGLLILASRWNLTNHSRPMSDRQHPKITVDAGHS
jgi:hypothetical protein